MTVKRPKGYRLKSKTAPKGAVSLSWQAGRQLEGSLNGIELLLDFATKDGQDGNDNDGDKCQDQSILHEALTFLFLSE